MARICVDAGFLIGIYDRDDQYHAIAVRQFEYLFSETRDRNQLIAPWPILYECLGSRHAKDKRKAALFNQRWTFLYESVQLELLDDFQFRDKCFAEYLGNEARPLSLVDRVLRAMIADRRRYFDFFLTYNSGDFADACDNGAIVLINEHSLPESYGI
jgi:predicted nucleic acid-binding protein